MNIFRFVFCLVLTAASIFLLNNSWNVKGTPIPALGKFLDPFHGFWQNIETEDAPVPDELDIPGLQQPVSVIYDSLLIPHIFAENDHDLYLAQGYITATHRLWQMEFQVQAAAGRISEILGYSEGVLDYDRRQRRLGMVYGAEHALEAMMNDPEVASALTAYTEGVNAYIQSLDDDDLPLEYKLLNYRPEPWTPLKMGLLLKNLSQTLNMSDRDLEMTNALRIFGKDVVDLLYFDNETPTGEPIVDNPGGWNFPTVQLDTVALALPTELIPVSQRQDPPRGIGSNNWAVHGSKTAGGNTLLCNDPHLNLTFPSIWYVVHLHAPDVNVMGASLPGAPGVVVGFNDSIGWAVTNAQRDLVDWYRIEYQDTTRRAYRTDDKWKLVDFRVEEIRIRGQEPFYDTVRYTHHGPVVYDLNFHHELQRSGYAFRWIAHDGSLELKTLLHLNRAHNHGDYMKALDYWSAPAQNFAFASASGDIAMRIQGKFPVRREDEGRYVLDGSQTSSEWQAFIPFDHNVMTLNPPRGFVSSANQFPVDETYPYYVQGVNYETYRNRRINSVLGAKDSLTVADMMALQNDNYNLQAAESLPVMLSLLDKTALRGKENEIVIGLGNWDFFNTAESVAASWYEEWWRMLNAMLWDEMRTDSVTLDVPNDFVTIHLMKTDTALSFYDIQSTPEKETLEDVVRQAFTESVTRIQAWEKEHGKEPQWADYKHTTVQHLARLAPFSTTVRVGGGPGIVNAAGSRSGPSWRMIVSLGDDGVRAWGVYPGGQSGNPGSAFYDNMIPYWTSGKYYALNFFGDADAYNAKALFTTQLNPK